MIPAIEIVLYIAIGFAICLVTTEVEKIIRFNRANKKKKGNTS